MPLHAGQDEGRYVATVTASQPQMSWGEIALHVAMPSRSAPALSPGRGLAGRLGDR